MGINHESFYYVRMIEKVEIALADMFNGMRVNKYSDINRKIPVKTVDVPLVVYYDPSFGNWVSNNRPKDRILRLPMAGLRLDQMSKDGVFRSQATATRAIFSRATDQWIRDLQPTPYKLTYTLSLLMDSRSDLGQLLENITPYFNTSRSLRINEFDFARDIERKIPVTIGNPNIKMTDGITNNDAKHNYIEVDIPFTLNDVPMYRPLELAEIIKYAELNVRAGDIVGSHQWFIYPDSVVDGERKPWETVGESTKEGWSFVRSICRTLKRQVELDGTISYENISPELCSRPVGVPSTKQLQLLFNEDTDTEIDYGGFNRDFVILNDASREFLRDMPPGGGQEVDGGYTSNTDWNQILTWFGSDDGEHQSPFSFDARIQFINEVPKDTIFQRLENKAIDGISQGEVFFEWGLEDYKPYFQFKTVGSNALSLKYVSDESMKEIVNSVDIFRFIFVLYNKGNDGIFAYSTNDGDTIAQSTSKEIF